MIFFFMQSLMLVGTLIWAYVLYVRLTLFLKPEKEDDDRYEVLRSSFEEKRANLRRAYNQGHRYRNLNLLFVYYLVILTIRTGVYVGVRLTSAEKILRWTFIKPVAFYLTYSTDLLIVLGVLYFIVNSAPPKD